MSLRAFELLDKMERDGEARIHLLHRYASALRKIAAGLPNAREIARGALGEE